MPGPGEPFARLLFRWDEVVEALAGRIHAGAPEAHGRKSKWKIVPRGDGLMIELYDEERFVESLAPKALVRAVG